MTILISCETGGSFVPPRLIDSERGLRAGEAAEPVPVGPGMPWQPGDRYALYSAHALAKCLGTKLLANQYSPTLIDVSRLLRHRDVFSSHSKRLGEQERRFLVQEVYDPYRERISQQVRRLLHHHGRCVHVSVRTFPLGEGEKIRRTDAGLAYDPSCKAEVDFCIEWIDDMYDLLPMLKVRRNYPRRGTADSLTREMRRQFGSRGYLGIELQLNQAWVGREVQIRDEVLHGIADSLDYMLQEAIPEAA